MSKSRKHDKANVHVKRFAYKQIDAAWLHSLWRKRSETSKLLPQCLFVHEQRLLLLELHCCFQVCVQAPEIL